MKLTPEMKKWTPRDWVIFWSKTDYIEIDKHRRLFKLEDFTRLAQSAARKQALEEAASILWPQPQTHYDSDSYCSGIQAYIFKIRALIEKDEQK